jgi:putative Ca2+/H+ antiporter (TMEM165/GDT1 family)
LITRVSVPELAVDRPPERGQVSLRIFLETFGIVFLAELGDKTQLAAVALATRFPPRRAFVGIALAFALLNGAAVAVGRGLFALVPHGWVQASSAALFLMFGALTLRGGDRDEEPEESKVRGGPIATSFLLILFAELGDKTQIATATLAAQYALPVAVFVASTLALWLVSAMGLWLGARLTRRIPMAIVHRAAGLAFVAFGLLSAWQALHTFAIL